MKRLDLSVLPEGFLVEIQMGGISRWRIVKFHEVESFSNVTGIRPALDINHFSDGSMILPDGLVIDFVLREGLREGFEGRGFTIDNEINLIEDYERLNVKYFRNHPDDIIAVKILGVTEEYREHGEELGMTVVEL